MNLVKKIWQNRWVMRSLARTVYFNLRCLPLRQAWRLPILLYKPKIKTLSGSIIIDGPVTPGMIVLGRNLVPLYPNSGISIECRGTLRFKGHCTIGNASALCVGPAGSLTIGDDFISSAAFRVAAYSSIAIGDHCRFGWDCMLLDSDFHALTRPDGTLTRGHAPIAIGERCWLGTGCLVQKGTALAQYTTVQARTVLAGDYMHLGPRSVIGERRNVAVKAADTYRDLDNDKINYFS